MTGRCVALAAEWETISKQWDHPTEEVINRTGDRQGEIEEELAKTPAATLADAAAKARILAEWEHDGISTEVGLAASLLADLERMAGGRVMTSDMALTARKLWLRFLLWLRARPTGEEKC
jgi:hypothetical protein